MPTLRQPKRRKSKKNPKIRVVSDSSKATIEPRKVAISKNTCLPSRKEMELLVNLLTKDNSTNNNDPFCFAVRDIPIFKKDVRKARNIGGCLLVTCIKKEKSLTFRITKVLAREILNQIDGLTEETKSMAMN